MNELQCAQAEEMLSDFLEGGLPPDATADFSAHLLSCSDCSKLTAQVRDLTTEMRALERVPEPPYLAKKIVRATLGERESGWRSWLSWTSLIWQPQFAMGAVTVVASLLILLHVTGTNAGNLSMEDMNPTTVAHVANRRVHLAYAHGVRFVNDLRVVYDIESLLAPPAANGPTHPEQTAPSTDPQQKSNVVPHGDGTEARRASATDMEASLSVPLNLYRSAP
jgi:hypothetical protein